MASVIVPQMKKDTTCSICQGKCMREVYPNVYEACRNCIPYTPLETVNSSTNYNCSACRDSNVSYWATDVSSPCMYCKSVKVSGVSTAWTSRGTSL